MALLETQAYAHGFDDETFMQNAGSAVAYAVEDYVGAHGCKKSVLILAGKGNNAGDAYVAGIRLLEDGYQVIAYSASEDSSESSLCRKNKKIFLGKGGKLFDAKDLPKTPFKEGVILDGLFGTGLNKALKAPYDQMIVWANSSKNPIIAIDIPSGLSGDTGEVLGSAIKAKLTVALGLPKIGFFLQDGWNYVGELKIVNFGLPKEPVDALKTPIRLYEKEKCIEKFPPIVRRRHKYEAGEVIALAGSPGMGGAANLTTLASLKSGCGITRLFHPAGMEAELSSSPYELIKIPYETDDVSAVVHKINAADSFLVGPGLGRDKKTGDFLKKILEKVEVKTVIDADALFFLAEEKFEIPKNAILTPHLGEMNRFFNTHDRFVTLEYLARCREFAKEHEINLVLKGAPSFIFSPEGMIWVNITGDPGMATAGSGDVLTGVIAGFLAQGMFPLDAALAGVCIHGWAGELASRIMSPYSMLAGDIINCLPLVFTKKLSS